MLNQIEKKPQVEMYLAYLFPDPARDFPSQLEDIQMSNKRKRTSYFYGNGITKRKRGLKFNSSRLNLKCFLGP